MPRQLTINPAPYKSSFLSIPPSPFSPLWPITPPASPPKNTSQQSHVNKVKTTAALVPPPSKAMHWLWQCHKCSRVYQLGITRRCLNDGHFFCAGSTVIKRSKKCGTRVVRHQACASEFDYAGWKAWGNWRRELIQQVSAAEALLEAETGYDEMIKGEGRWFENRWLGRKSSTTMQMSRPEKEATRGRKNCWARCDYPSECRWGNQHEAAAPVVVSSPPQMDSCAVEEGDEQDFPPKISTSFEEILLGLSAAPTPGSPMPTAPEATSTPELSFLEPIDLTLTKTSSHKPFTVGETAKPSMEDLLESAKRRKRRSLSQIPSPLGANPLSPTFAIAEGCTDVKMGGMSLDDSEVGVTKGRLGDGLQERADAFLRGWNVVKRK